MPALTSHTPPWNCPATSLTQRRVYSIGLAMGACVRNCWGRKQGSPAAQRGAHRCAQRAAASWAAVQRCRAADTSRLQQQDSLEAGAVNDERQTAWASGEGKHTCIKLEAIDASLLLQAAQPVHKPRDSFRVCHIQSHDWRCVPPPEEARLHEEAWGRACHKVTLC